MASICTVQLLAAWVSAVMLGEQRFLSLQWVSVNLAELLSLAVQVLGWHLRPLHVRSPAQDVSGRAEAALHASRGQGEEYSAAHDLHHQLSGHTHKHGSDTPLSCAVDWQHL